MTIARLLLIGALVAGCGSGAEQPAPNAQARPDVGNAADLPAPAPEGTNRVVSEETTPGAAPAVERPSTPESSAAAQNSAARGTGFPSTAATDSLTGPILPDMLVRPRGTDERWMVLHVLRPLSEDELEDVQATMLADSVREPDGTPLLPDFYCDAGDTCAVLRSALGSKLVSSQLLRSDYERAPMALPKKRIRPQSDG